MLLVIFMMLNLLGGGITFNIGIVDEIEDEIADFINAIGNAFEDFINSVKNAITYPIDLLKSAFYDAYDWFSDKLGWAAPIGFVLVMGITIFALIAIIKRIPSAIA